RIPFAHSCHGRVNRQREGVESSFLRAFNRPFCHFAPTNQIHLIPRHALGGRTHVFQLVPRNCRKRVARPCRTCSGGSCHFSPWMHQSAVAHRREHSRKRNLMSQHRCSNLVFGKRNRATRPEQNPFELPAIFPQRDLSLSSSIQIIKRRARHPPLRNLSQILDIHRAW